ncbi:MAG: alpha-L-rhamnosidase C-terminal domain-containing protein [Bacteroidia bacterium]
MNADLENPGYKHIIFRPQLVDDIHSVKYHNQTAYGLAGINWKKTGKDFSMEITVPVGSKATVYVPLWGNENVKEGGKLANQVTGVVSLGKEGNYKMYEVGSGVYQFQTYME